MMTSRKSMAALAVVIAGGALAAIAPLVSAMAQGATRSEATEKPGARIPVSFRGGYETDPRDRGRPVILIANALGVTPEVFRAAFSGVHPAAAGQAPEPGQVRDNKAVLLRALGPYGITNDRLDTVSNYYRYNRSRGEWWRTTPAAAVATVRDGVVTAITITSPGSGYSSTPEITVPGAKLPHYKVNVAYGTDFKKNGSITSITLDAHSGGTR